MERTRERELGIVADLLEQGKGDVAQRMLRHMLRKDPNNVEVWWVVANTAPRTQAIGAVQEILRISPAHEGARRLLAHLHQLAEETKPDFEELLSERTMYACQQCAAQLAIISVIPTRCPFCDNPLQEDEKVLMGHFEEIDQLLPFSYKRDRAAEFVQSWLKNSWLLPPRIKRNFRETWLIPVFIPFWRVDATLKGTWKAEENETGDLTAEVHDLLYSASAHVTESQWKAVLNYQLAHAAPYISAELKDYVVNLPAVTQDQALLPVRGIVLEALHNQNPVLDNPDLNVRLSHEQESWKLIMLPFYIMTYAYGGRRYQILVNGQTGDLDGGRPVEWRRAIVYMVLLLFPGLVLTLLGGSTGVSGALILPLLILFGGLVMCGFVLNEAFSYDRPV